MIRADPSKSKVPSSTTNSTGSVIKPAELNVAEAETTSELGKVDNAP